jgi:hypothetical protein
MTRPSFYAKLESVGKVKRKGHLGSYGFFNEIEKEHFNFVIGVCNGNESLDKINNGIT